MDQPGEVANPARGQLNREKMSKRLGGNIGCKYKNSSWDLNGLVNSIKSVRNPPLYCTHIK